MTQIKWFTFDNRIREYLITSDNLFRDVFIIKRNNRRTIYRIPVNDTIVLFIKHDHPRETRHKIKALFFPKAKSEYDSAISLHKKGIPIIPVIGWGKKGTESFLITKEIPGAVPLTELFYQFSISKKDMNNLLTGISKFLRLLVEKEVKHPDLHAGNVLVKRLDNGFSFYLVDLYGIKSKGDFRKRDVYRLFGWLVTILWCLDEVERDKFLIQAGFCKDGADLKKEWERLVAWRLSYIKGRCRKRRKKLFQNSSICNSYNSGSQHLVIKREWGIKQIKRGYVLRRLSHYDAEKAWLNSYFLGLFGIPVLTHYAWLKCRNESILIMEQTDGITLKDMLKIGGEKERDAVRKAIDRLYKWCKRADIDISLDPDKAYIRQEGLFPLIFSNPEMFSLVI